MDEANVENYRSSPIDPPDEGMAPPLKKSPPKTTTATTLATPPSNNTDLG